MSGPKDFVFVFAAARLAAMLAHRAALQQARKAEAQARRQIVRERMQNLSADVAVRRASTAEKARRAAEERFRLLAAQSARRLAGAEQTATAAASSESPDAMADRFDRFVAVARDGLARLDNVLDLDGDSKRRAFELELESLATASRDSKLLERAEELQHRISHTAQHVEQQCPKWQEAMVALHAWEEQLANDAAVRQFASPAAVKWKDESAALMAKTLGIDGIDAMVTRAQALCDDAEKLHTTAGEHKAKFDERNELLGDILSSLQEIGFFVSDPQYEDPNDPAGAVIIKATRGSEEVTASVDLSDMVRTVWNGVADEKCKDSFFQYIDQMSNKGIEITATRPDLQSRPILKQAGARELPRTKLRGEGG